MSIICASILNFELKHFREGRHIHFYQEVMSKKMKLEFGKQFYLKETIMASSSSEVIDTTKPAFDLSLRNEQHFISKNSSRATSL